MSSSVKFSLLMFINQDNVELYYEHCSKTSTCKLTFIYNLKQLLSDFHCFLGTVLLLH